MSNDYSVKKGDTLWGIANHHGLTVKQLADWNSLQGRHVHDLKIGQLIHLKPINQTDDVELELTIKLLDLAFEPIKKATLRLEYDSKTRTENITNGQISNLLIEDHSKGLKVYFKNITGTFDLIADHKRLPVGRKTLTLTSRAVKVKGTYAAQEGVVHRTINTIQRELKGIHDAILNPPQSPPPPQSDDHETKPEHKSVSTPAPVKQDTPKQKTSTITAQTAPQPKASVPPPPKVPSAEVKPINQTMRTDGGEHTHVVAVQFTEDNLLLAPENNKYRKYIVDAAKRNGFSPQGLAALINAEAAKLPNKDKKKPAVEWNPKSKASSSSASGLTQFLDAPWIDMSKNSASLVGQYVKKHGKLSKSEILKLRFNPEFAIDAAAVYAKDNISHLKTGFDVPTEKITDPSTRAKLAYLLHHEGAKGGYLFITNKLSLEKAKSLLFTQFGNSKEGKKKAEAYLKRYNGDGKVAYGNWLRAYVDDHISISHFTAGNLKPQEPTIDSAIAQLGGVSLAGNKPAPKTVKPNVSTNKITPASAPQQTSTSTEGQASNSKPLEQGVGGEKKWHNPLDQCVIRTAGLASAKSATFGYVRNNGKRAHQGVDLAANPGTPIYAVAGGVIALTTTHGDYGKWIVLQVDINDLPQAQKNYAISKLGASAKFVYFFYAHLSSVSVSAKDIVSAGDPIGKTGDTGNAAGMSTIAKGAHLHFEARPIKEMQSGLDGHIDPIPFITVKLI